MGEKVKLEGGGRKLWRKLEWKGRYKVSEKLGEETVRKCINKTKKGNEENKIDKLEKRLRKQVEIENRDKVERVGWKNGKKVIWEFRVRLEW